MTVPTKLMTSILAGAALALTLTSTPTLAKQCYAPDALAQQRAFSRAVITEGGKTVWLGGQTGSPNLNFEGQVRKSSLSWIRPLERSGAAA